MMGGGYVGITRGRYSWFHCKYRDVISDCVEIQAKDTAKETFQALRYFKVENYNRLSKKKEKDIIVVRH